MVAKNRFQYRWIINMVTNTEYKVSGASRLENRTEK
jgi:hypothetical protein